MKRSAGLGALFVTVLLALGLVGTGAAHALWSITSGSGGSGAAQATILDPGAAPDVVSSGSSMIVTWDATTLQNGQAVSGYLVKRYSTDGQAQGIGSDCAGVIAGLGCIEANVPAGDWYYTVTPVVGAHWTGPESAPGTTGASDGHGSTNTVWMWVTP